VAGIDKAVDAARIHRRTVAFGNGKPELDVRHGGAGPMVADLGAIPAKVRSAVVLPGRRIRSL